MDGRKAVGSDILGLEVGRSVIRGVLLNAAVTNVVDFAEVSLDPMGMGGVGSGSADCSTVGPALHHLLEQLHDRGRSVFAAGLALGPRCSGVGSGPELRQWLEGQASSLDRQFVHAGQIGIAFAPWDSVEAARDVCRLAGIGLVRVDLAPVAAARVLTDSSLEVTTLGSGLGWRARLRDLEVVEAIERTDVPLDAPFRIRTAYGQEEPVTSYRRIAVPPILVVDGFDAGRMAVAVGAAVGVANRSQGDLLHGEVIGSPPSGRASSTSRGSPSSPGPRPPVGPDPASATGPNAASTTRTPPQPSVRPPDADSSRSPSNRFDFDRGTSSPPDAVDEHRSPTRTGPVERQVGQWSVLSTHADPVELFSPDPEQEEKFTRGEGRTRLVATVLTALIVVALPLYILIGLGNDDQIENGAAAGVTDTTVTTVETPDDDEQNPDLLSTESTAEGPVALDGEETEFDDWPGGRGPTPAGPPIPRQALFDDSGLLLLTGSVPSWAVAIELVESTGARLPGGVGSVDNQLTWHPDAKTDHRSGSARLDPPLLYPSGAAAVPDEAKPGLDLVAEILTENPSVFIVVVAQTDDLGDTEENNAVAFARATGIVDYLRSVGADESQIVVAADDNPTPVVPNDSDEGLTFNRRVEIHFENLLSSSTGP